MRARATVVRLRRDLDELRERVATADLGAVPVFVVQAGGTFVSDDLAYNAYATLDDALATVPDRGAFVARAVVVDMSAGIGDVDAYGNVLDDYDDEDDPVSVPIPRPQRPVDPDALEPIPGLIPGVELSTGRKHYGTDLAGHRIRGLIAGAPVTSDDRGRLVFVADLEP